MDANSILTGTAQGVLFGLDLFSKFPILGPILVLGIALYFLKNKSSGWMSFVLIVVLIAILLGVWRVF